jgi:hypothetical protein
MVPQYFTDSAGASWKQPDRLLLAAFGVLLFVALAGGVAVFVDSYLRESEMDRIFRTVPQDPPFRIIQPPKDERRGKIRLPE